MEHGIGSIWMSLQKSLYLHHYDKNKISLKSLAGEFQKTAVIPCPESFFTGVLKLDAVLVRLIDLS